MRYTFTMTDRDPISGPDRVEVEVNDPDASTLVETFEAFVLACGFQPETVADMLGKDEPAPLDTRPDDDMDLE